MNAPERSQPPAHLLDMDGVLVRGSEPIAGSIEYVQLLAANEIPFLILSNNPRFTQKGLSEKLSGIGFPIEPENVFTSAMATALFVKSQSPSARYFSVCDEGLEQTMVEHGLEYDDQDPEYVIVGESLNFSFQDISKGVRFVASGARFIGTNPDATTPSPDGMIPACGAVCALVQAATGVAPYYVGKPNPYMMRSALTALGVHADQAIMVGDRMDTDIIAGKEMGLRTVLVLTGASCEASVKTYPYSPDLTVRNLGSLQEHFDLQ